MLTVSVYFPTIPGPVSLEYVVPSLPSYKVENVTLFSTSPVARLVKVGVPS